jgi:hypothetical protein
MTFKEEADVLCRETGASTTGLHAEEPGFELAERCDLVRTRFQGCEEIQDLFFFRSVGREAVCISGGGTTGGRARFGGALGRACLLVLTLEHGADGVWGFEEVEHDVGVEEGGDLETRAEVVLELITALFDELNGK